MIYNIDLSQAENRIVAYMANDKNMIKAFTDPFILKNGGVHSYTASVIYDIPITEVSKEKGSSGFNANLSQRDIGKRCNHALNYRMGPNTFAEAADITISYAKKLRNLYLKKTYPMVEQGYWKWVEEQINNYRRVTNLFGRSYRAMDRWGESLLQQMCAFPPQSTVAHIINEYGLNAMARDQKTFGPVDPLGQNHDAIWFQISDQIPLDVHAMCIHKLQDSLLVELCFEDRRWTIPCDLSAGYNLGYFDKEKNPEGQRDVPIDNTTVEKLKEVQR